MKKLICTLFALAMCASFAACGGEPAETTNSKDEQAAATTTGSAAHEHTWVDATCQAPKTCSECGETEGEIGTHNYENKVCTVCGVEKTSEGLQFMLNDAGDGYIVIGIGICMDLDVVIPSTHEGKPVTEIGESAFEDCRTIISVTVPDSVTAIADRAFYDCMRLESVTISDGVTSIGRTAFKDCYKLTNIIIPDSVTSIDYDTFGCYFDAPTIIYCEAESKPDGWDFGWTLSSFPVYWGGEWEYVDGVPTVK